MTCKMNYQDGDSTTEHLNPQEQSGHVTADEHELTLQDQKKGLADGDSHEIEGNTSPSLKVLKKEKVTGLSPRKGHSMDKLMQTATAIRKFNRFYLPYFHLLTQKYLNTDYSVAEARILYEIYEEQEISATDIVNALHVDKGYLSRILKKFEAKSIIERKAYGTDSRRTLVVLTENGKTLAKSLIAESNMQISKELESLSEDEMDKLAYHMRNIANILGGT